MSLINLNNISKMFSGEYIFENINFSIEKKDKIGLIGRNGTGKTTIFKIINGNENIDINRENKIKGSINRSKNLKIGYLTQHMKLDENKTVFNEMMDKFSEIQILRKKIDEVNHSLKDVKGKALKIKMEELANLNSKYESLHGHELEYRIRKTLNGLGIDESYYNQKIENLSGGEKNRVALAGILVETPELLLLDEPTNHLDINAIEWLENYLQDYNGSFILISHDRYFMNKTVNNIMELENKKIISYNGDFDDFIMQKEERLKQLTKEYEKQQVKIEKTEEFIRKYKAGIKSKQARGREKQLNRLVRMDNPNINIKNVNLKFEPEDRSVDLVLEAKNISKNYDNNIIFNNTGFKLYRGERIGVIGDNGTGKSTLLKMISNKEEFEGTINTGERVKIGYYDQNQENLTYENTILEELLTKYIMSEEEARNILGGFLFTDEEVNKKIQNLSGGEKARICFAKLLIEKPNFLIMDEPTNHLDIYTKEVLEDALADYEGTIITVSHDREFLKNIVNDIYIISNHKIEKFNGNYEDYKNREGYNQEKQETKAVDYKQEKKIKNRKNNLNKMIESKHKEVDEMEKLKAKKELELEKLGKENDFEKLMEVDKEIKKLEDDILNLMFEIDEHEEEIKSL